MTLVWFSVFAFIFIDINHIIIHSTDTPIIGILTLPCNEDEQNCKMENTTFRATTYLPASYAKFIEGGGGQVYPLLSDMDKTKMREIVAQLNGILFTGGDAPFTKNDYYWEQILNILSYIRQYHDQNKNVAIPVWGNVLEWKQLFVKLQLCNI